MALSYRQTRGAVNLATIRDKVKVMWKVKDRGTLLNPADKSYQDKRKSPSMLRVSWDFWDEAEFQHSWRLGVSSAPLHPKLLEGTRARGSLRKFLSASGPRRKAART